MLCCVEAAWFSDSIIHTLLLWQTLQEYFKYVSSMNQVASLCRQIQSDVTSGQHKYMAHQIALLYQSLGALGKPAVEVRKEIAKLILFRVLQSHQHDWNLCISAAMNFTT